MKRPPLYTLTPPRARFYAHVARARLRRGDDPPPLPSATHLVITWRCNARCDGCGAWEREPAPELSAQQWRAVFAQLWFLDIVKIIGGEPFVRADLEQVVQAIRDEINPHVVQLVTNGLQTDRIVRFAEQCAWPNLHLRLSLDGLEQTHDASRGVPGIFSQVMATMEALSALRRRGKRFQLAVNFTVTDDSLLDMEQLIERCHDLGVDVVPGFKVKPFLHHTHVSPEKFSTIGMRAPAAALAKLDRRDLGARGGFSWLERLALRAVNAAVFRKHVQGGDALKFRCRELRNLMYLMPGGELVTCGLNHEPVGNLAEQPFEQLWRSQRADRFRQAVDSCPGCMQGAVEVLSKGYGG